VLQITPEEHRDSTSVNPELASVDRQRQATVIPPSRLRRAGAGFLCPLSPRQAASAAANRPLSLEGRRAGAEGQPNSTLRGGSYPHHLSQS
jgi:hypothetical protein